MPSLYLIRHAEPALKGVLTGQIDPPLSPEGVQQCLDLNISVEVFYASSLRRSSESARLIARGTRVIELEDLAEISLGAWDGKTWGEVEASDPQIAAAKLADWTGVTPPGGENWADFTARVDRALEHVRRGPFPAAVVGHAAVNGWISHRLAGTDPIQFIQRYAEVTLYEL